MSYRGIHRNKKHSDAAENNTAVASFKKEAMSKKYSKTVK